MITTRRQQAMDLIERYQIDSDDFLQFMINDYMGGGELLAAVLSYVSDELGIDDVNEAE
jgi:hypothetical protein